MNLKVPLSRGGVFEELKLFADEVGFAWIYFKIN